MESARSRNTLGLHGPMETRAAWTRASELSLVAGLVCATYGLSPRDLTAPTRLGQPIARARQIAVYLAHVGLGITLSAAAHWFGRDPSTASHACRVIENARDLATFDLALARLESALNHWRADNPFHVKALGEDASVGAAEPGEGGR